MALILIKADQVRPVTWRPGTKATRDKIRWRAGPDYRELKTGRGLDHFEGRSYLGWHRHVTLAALAQAFCTMLRGDPQAPAPR